MRKGISDGQGATTPFTRTLLDEWKRIGYRFVQVKGLTSDYHFDYIEPSKLVLVPIYELSDDPSGKDIYEPIESDLLARWASGEESGVNVFV